MDRKGKIKRKMPNLDFEIMKFLFKEKKALKVGEIAKKRNIPHSTLGSCIVRLKAQGYVKYKPYYDVKLTVKGKELAKELLRHQDLIEILLYRELNLSKNKVHKESEKFHLLFSCEIINKICEKYGHPKKCLCGESILDSHFCFCKELSN